MGYYKPRDFSPGGYYHIYNRGNAKQNIFLQEEDYIFYLNRLRQIKDKQKISLICYCLMPNHLHLLVRQDSDALISKFISLLHSYYVMYFNNKYDRAGHLFQDRFKHKTIDKDEYLLYLSSYIHLNPLIDGFTGKLEDYPWSSYPDYIDLRKGTLCDKESILLGKIPKDYQRIVEVEVKEKLIGRDFDRYLDLLEHQSRK